MKEINILKRLKHQQIINLVGTYTEVPHLGLLLCPVAVTDLWTLLEDIDHLRQTHLGSQQTDRTSSALKRLLQLEVFSERPLSFAEELQRAMLFIRSHIGCIASAVAYLQQNQIRHKDLKPSNVLVSGHGLYLTDFGTATDFSNFTQSITESGERGTPKYFSPEAASYEPCGRASDIFSLGCIIFEIILFCNGYSLNGMKKPRPNLDHSFQANLELLNGFFGRVDVGLHDRSLLGEIKMMLRVRPQSRPTITHFQKRVRLIDVISSIPFSSVSEESNNSSRYMKPCCESSFVRIQIPSATRRILLRLTYGNTVNDKQDHGPDTARDWTFFLWPSELEIVDKAYMFLRLLVEHPFEFSHRSWKSQVIGVAVMLRYGYAHKSCGDFIAVSALLSDLPKQRMIKFEYRINLEQPMSQAEIPVEIYKVGSG